MPNTARLARPSALRFSAAFAAFAAAVVASLAPPSAIAGGGAAKAKPAPPATPAPATKAAPSAALAASKHVAVYDGKGPLRVGADGPELAFAARHSARLEVMTPGGAAPPASPSEALALVLDASAGINGWAEPSSLITVGRAPSLLAATAGAADAAAGKLPKLSAPGVVLSAGAEVKILERSGKAVRVQSLSPIASAEGWLPLAAVGLTYATGQPRVTVSGDAAMAPGNLTLLSAPGGAPLLTLTGDADEIIDVTLLGPRKRKHVLVGYTDGWTTVIGWVPLDAILSPDVTGGIGGVEGGVEGGVKGGVLGGELVGELRTVSPPAGTPLHASPDGPIIGRLAEEAMCFPDQVRGRFSRCPWYTQAGSLWVWIPVTPAETPPPPRRPR
jgi:hypothetical protein